MTPSVTNNTIKCSVAQLRSRWADAAAQSLVVHKETRVGPGLTDTLTLKSFPLSHCFLHRQGISIITSKDSFKTGIKIISTDRAPDYSNEVICLGVYVIWHRRQDNFISH